MMERVAGMDHETLVALREHHPAWRLLASQHAPLTVELFWRAFVAPNRRQITQADLVEALEDQLFELRARLGPDAFPRSALAYVEDWAAPERGRLRKFYEIESNEPHYDITPAAEKGVRWLSTLTARQFVGTESRLLTLFELLRQMSEGSESDPEIRIAHLQRRRAEIDAEIAQIEAGNVPLLDDVSVRDRFQQFTLAASDLFAILDEIRRRFDHVESFLMDRETLLEFDSHWDREPAPETRNLPRLRPFEAALYDELRTNRYGAQVRLEQERISFAWFCNAMAQL